MAYYFLFPENDATVYSHPDRINMNTGGDELLELVKEVGSSDQYHYPSRVFIKFKDSEMGSLIEDTITSDLFSSSAEVRLQLSSVEAKNLLETHLIEAYAVSQSWNEGTNKYLNLPSSSNGVTWINRDGSTLGSAWTTSSIGGIGSSSIHNTSSGQGGFCIEQYETEVGTSGSINSLVITPGGGVWYTGSGYETNQQFIAGDSLDTNLNVTEIVRKFSASYLSSQTYPTGIINNGFLIKTVDSIETNVSYSFGELKYFSVDTHTIYPPKLVFKWDDSSYSATDNIKTSGDLNVSLYNIKKEYNQNDEALIKIHVRDKYPTRTFTTSSNYLNIGYLTTASFYSIRDAHTEQEIIPFDKDFTKISSDNNGNYFKIYMKGLQPERYYRFLIKHTNHDGTTIYDNDYYFKVVR